ncbi:MAG: hypothetical protein ACOY5F_14410 [Pseudomonadota bacterium]
MAEPERKCRNCEFFDGGGLRPDGNPVMVLGDCLHGLSPHFNTSADDSCKCFYPCSTRWPKDGEDV